MNSADKKFLKRMAKLEDQKKHCGSASGSIAVVSCFVQVFEAIKTEMQDDFTYWQIVEVVDTPKGEYQSSPSELFEHEYIDQRQIGPEGDSFTGSIYFPVGDGRYIRVGFDS